MLQLTFMCVDDWDRPVYKDQNAKLWLDVNLGKGVVSLYSSSNNRIDGEPCLPMKQEYHFISVYKEDPHRFDYMMLDRLRSDCDYYLGCGRRNEGCVSGKNGIGTIAEMKRLWNCFPLDAKPEWLSLEDIVEYENEMTMSSGKFNDPYAWSEYRRSKKKANVPS